MKQVGRDNRHTDTKVSCLIMVILTQVKETIQLPILQVCDSSYKIICDSIFKGKQNSLTIPKL